MPVDPRWRSWMTETVTLEAPTGRSSAGEPTYSGATVQSVAAFVYGKTRMVRDFAGNEVVSNVTVVLDRSVAPTPEWRLTLPATWSPRQPKILSVARHRDEVSAPYYDTLYC